MATLWLFMEKEQNKWDLAFYLPSSFPHPTAPFATATATLPTYHHYKTMPAQVVEQWCDKCARQTCVCFSTTILSLLPSNPKCFPAASNRYVTFCEKTDDIHKWQKLLTRHLNSGG